MILSFREEKKILEKHVELQDRLLFIFAQDKVDEKSLYGVLEEMNKLRRKKVEINKDILKQKDILDTNVLDAYSICYKEISTISEKLIIDEIPTLNLANVTNFLNIFSNIYLPKNTKDEKEKGINKEIKHVDNNGKIIVLANDDMVPLKFKNGRKILLTVNNFDLSIFTSDELIELLRLLDIIVSDNKYDFLRSEIAKQIATISTISLLKE